MGPRLRGDDDLEDAAAALRIGGLSVAPSFETPACGGLLRMRSEIHVRMRSEILMVRSAATPRVSNHVVGIAFTPPLA
jgi:hypothetical protein